MPKQRSQERSGPSSRLSDPYLVKKIPEPNICPVCGLVYYKKRWRKDEQLKAELEEVAYKYKCPACRKIEDHYPMGIVTVSGNFWPTVKDQIINLIHHQEEKESFTNPLARIISLNYRKDVLVVETTTENLAIMIGKALNRAYKGELKISFSDNKIARVNWQRSIDLGKIK
ncbi:MAG: BCAM0308 family protein [candidate division WOR-3 bacterium]|nr:BCAM0308 family protein [candidate division WOR-3 bacterium]MDW7987775.1 BCAM0308 family protein [candidate division WOR-3 bacterium]